MKKVLNIIISVILWIVILLAAMYAFVTLATRDSNNVASIAGFSPLTVQSQSMSPTFNAGDLIIIKKVDKSTLKEGDIITFHTIIENQYALNTHRIISIDDSMGARSYTTQGDNNVIADTHTIADGDIVGKYICRIPKFGYVMDFLSGKIGFLVVIVLPLLIFFIYQIYHLIMVIIDLKRATALEIAEEVAAKANGGNAPTPAAEPTPAPAAEPTPAPVVEPTLAPVVEPTPAPVVEPTPEPIVEPTPAPVVEPIPAPVVEPTPAPVVEPTPAPVVEPTPAPVAEAPKATLTEAQEKAQKAQQALEDARRRAAEAKARIAELQANKKSNEE